jgi:hypothetical protein
LFYIFPEEDNKKEAIARLDLKVKTRFFKNKTIIPKIKTINTNIVETIFYN